MTQEEIDKIESSLAEYPYSKAIDLYITSLKILSKNRLVESNTYKVNKNDRELFKLYRRLLEKLYPNIRYENKVKKLYRSIYFGVIDPDYWCVILYPENDYKTGSLIPYKRDKPMIKPVLFMGLLNSDINNKWQKIIAPVYPTLLSVMTYFMKNNFMKEDDSVYVLKTIKNKGTLDGVPIPTGSATTCRDLLSALDTM